ncbi:retrovirus-related pol polyprotein from transposon TNT 1-94 [Tanacetum coccineum]|uniref:Retrovirus-related pol polyprotein from transposon TNT 1-94 n=1 Tax=Tanacetum coccineum TaxID=301880 RepID=A0ABQ5DET8_9ASTR
MHNNIMAAGSKERPPMLGPGRYSQWRSRFLRYLDTKSNGEYLRKCIFEGPYTPTSVLIAAVEAAENIQPVAAHEEAETIHNMTTENKLYFQAEKEAIFLILTGIGDEIYSTVDACNTAKEMWTAIERLQQGESLNVQDVKTNLFWEFGKFTSRDGESMESYYSRFYKLMNELTRNNLQVSPMQVNVQFLQQLQPEWSRFVTVVKQREEIDTVSYHIPNGDALRKCILKGPYTPTIVTTPAVPATEDSPTVPEQTTVENVTNMILRNERLKKCGEAIERLQQEDKDIAEKIALIAKYFKKLYKPTTNQPQNFLKQPKHECGYYFQGINNQTGQYRNQRAVNVVGARETVGGPVVLQSGIQCFNCKEFGHYAKECRKPKRVKDSTYHKEKMLLCKQAEKGVQLQAEQSDWLADTDEEIDEQELEAHYSYMAKIQEVPNADSGTYAEPLEQDDQNDVECDDERVALANLIANLKLDVDENKKIQKQLKKVESKELLIALQNKQTEFERYKAFNDRTVDYDKLEHKLNEALGLIAQKEIDIKEGLKVKAYEISVVKEKHDELVKQSLLTKSHYEGLVKEKSNVITD